MKRPGFDEFLKLEGCSLDCVAVRNRTKCAAAMRERRWPPIPIKGSFDAPDLASLLACELHNPCKSRFSVRPGVFQETIEFSRPSDD
jgi:hypothetical protein